MQAVLSIFLVTKSAPWSLAFLAEMLETGDENREPTLICVPLSLISHYFLLLKYLWGGTKAEIFARLHGVICIIYNDICRPTLK